MDEHQEIEHEIGKAHETQLLFCKQQLEICSKTFIPKTALFAIVPICLVIMGASLTWAFQQNSVTTSHSEQITANNQKIAELKIEQMTSLQEIKRNQVIILEAINKLKK